MVPAVCARRGAVLLRNPAVEQQRLTGRESDAEAGLFHKTLSRHRVEQKITVLIGADGGKARTGDEMTGLCTVIGLVEREGAGRGAEPDAGRVDVEDDG